MTAPAPLVAAGTISFRLPGSDRDVQIASFDVLVPYVVAVNAEGVAEGLVDQDALRVNLADALEAASVELPEGGMMSDLSDEHGTYVPGTDDLSDSVLKLLLNRDIDVLGAVATALRADEATAREIPIFGGVVSSTLARVAETIEASVQTQRDRLKELG